MRQVIKIITVFFSFFLMLFLAYALRPIQMNDIFPVQVEMNDSLILEQVNLQRTSKGYSALTMNEKLSLAARNKLEDMFINQYFEHTSPDDREASDLVNDAGYRFIVVGENLIQGVFTDEKDVVRVWMNSPGHRDNIMNRNYIETGVASRYGQFSGRNVFMSVQIFAVPASVCPEIDPIIIEEIEILESKLEILRLSIEEEKKRPVYNALVREYNEHISTLTVLVENHNRIVDLQRECFSAYK